MDTNSVSLSDELVDRMVCGYGGLRAPQKPRPLYLPGKKEEAVVIILSDRSNRCPSSLCSILQATGENRLRLAA